LSFNKNSALLPKGIPVSNHALSVKPTKLISLLLLAYLRRMSLRH